MLSFQPFYIDAVIVEDIPLVCAYLQSTFLSALPSPQLCFHREEYSFFSLHNSDWKEGFYISLFRTTGWVPQCHHHASSQWQGSSRLTFLQESLLRKKSPDVEMRKKVYKEAQSYIRLVTASVSSFLTNTHKQRAPK